MTAPSVPDRRPEVKEIVAVPETAACPGRCPWGEVAFDAGRANRDACKPENEAERLHYAEAVELIAGRFEVCVQRFAADSRAC